jgi:hypothetical protein
MYWHRRKNKFGLWDSLRNNTCASAKWRRALSFILSGQETAAPAKNFGLTTVIFKVLQKFAICTWFPNYNMFFIMYRM